MILVDKTVFLSISLPYADGTVAELSCPIEIYRCFLCLQLFCK